MNLFEQFSRYTDADHIWLAVGMLGQLLFSARFFLQWLVSEKHKRSIIPVSFWYFSIGGSAVLLAYAIRRADPVFILGQGAGFFIYLRNLWLIHHETKARAANRTHPAE
ncbi:MAG TPA: lipid-A-disaccharide synthase N-terminal domain-containing protein [Holophaga sp.]|nr:lipid-A-disaccharide synthase N-terminal domain-containing protein [Holophaga sp.]HPS67508.1 lipid-A-disaccharide synthase N-terminal domain-containing protein [Holophaga sp.]